MLPELPPSWDGLHPLVVHFPVALFPIATLFVLLATLSGSRSFMVASLLLMVIGTAGAYVSVSTGNEAYSVYEHDEAGELIDPDYEYDEVATDHQEQTTFARNVYLGITVFYLLVVLAAFVKPDSLKLVPRAVTGVIALGLLAWGNLLMANAAHLGGELVHVYGVRANIKAPEEEAEEETTDEESASEEESSDEGEDAATGEAA